MDLKTKNAQILIVDDAQDNIEVLKKILGQEDFKTHALTDGSKVPTFLQAQKIDLILLGFGMPDRNGLEICRQLKKHADTEEIPIIMITMANHKNDIIESFEAGAVDYVTHPFEPAELLSRVRSHLRNHFLYEELRHHIIENARLKREYERFLRHELKNLLTPIQGYAEVLKYKNNLDETSTEYVSYIFEGTQKFLHLIEDLKQIEDLENGDVPIRITTFKLLPVLKEVIEDFQTQTTKTLLDVPEEITLIGDRVLLRNALAHLAKNAYEHVQNLNDPTQNTITFRAGTLENSIQIEINNRGPEVPVEACETFFQKFNSKNKSGGVGLGTTYVFWVVKIHNGNISVSSNPQNGTTVTLSLPLKPHDDAL